MNDVNTMSHKVRQIAYALVDSGALRFGSFKLKSQQTSRFYIDLTMLLSSPLHLKCVVDIIAETVKDLRSTRKVDRLASVELKGALFLPSIASRVVMPCLVVRKARKEYGVRGRIVGGQVESGEHILFFDDVVTDGKSKLEAIAPLKDCGATVETVLVVVDREQGGRENLENRGLHLVAVATISEVVGNLVDARKITEEQASTILSSIN